MRTLALAIALLLAGAAQAEDSVSTYHGDLSRTGQYAAPGLTYERAAGLKPDPAFRAEFQGKVYAQPLLWRDPRTQRGELVVATENNEVMALDAQSGATIWTRALGPPVPRAALPCGNISPLGITGAPAIDEQSATLYLDAAVMRAGKPRHEIFAISLSDGKIGPGWPVDVAAALGSGFDPAVQNQRGALAVFGGKVFVPYSGHWGDCGAYHGFVVGVSTTNPKSVESFSTRARGGGIWAQGGVSSDGDSLFVVTGNTFGAREWSDGEAVLRLGVDLNRPTLPKDYFTPRDWRDLDGSDLDLGGTAALPLDIPGPTGPRKLVFAIGKNGTAYLLDRERLGGVGGALASTEVATNVAIASPAAAMLAEGMLVVLQGDGAHCPRASAGRGLVALSIVAEPAPRMETVWCAAVARSGSPIITTTAGHANAIVWTLGAEGDDRLHAFKAETGEAILVQLPVMTGLHHFQTVIAGGSRLYVAGDGRLYAFTY